MLLFSKVTLSQSENLVDVPWICTSIIINGNTILPPNDEEVQYVVLQMLQDADPLTEDFVSNVCDVLSSSDSTVSYNNTNVTFTITQLTQTLGGCPINQNFQSSYFGFYYSNLNMPLSYTINEINNTNTLTITSQNGDIANYQEFVLDLEENRLNEIKLHPNPASEIINIDNGINTIEKAEILSITGQIIKSINNPNSQIDITDISKGIYFLKLYEGENFITKRFIKN